MQKAQYEPWDFTWMVVAVQRLETYEAALETAEIPSSIIVALKELLQNPEANTSQLQEIFDVLLQMIAFPINLELSNDTVTTLLSARDWAIQTILDAQAVQSRNLIWDTLQPPTMSQSLQHMQTKLFVSGPCRLADVEIVLHQSLLAAIQVEEEKVLFDVLEMCATNLESDEQFLCFAEAALTGKTEALSLGTAFLQRLFDRRTKKLQVHDSIRQKRRLFNALTMVSKIRVWANNLPSWRSHLQAWMLNAQIAPFKPIGAVLHSGWRLQGATQVDIMAACRRHSHLYISFVEWCRDHVDLLSSCRSMELVCVLSQSLRIQNAAQLFHRRLISQMPLRRHLSEGWSRSQRNNALVALDCTLERLLATHSTSAILWQYEWIGVLEQPHLLHEALDAALTGKISSKIRLQDEDDLSVMHCATRFLGWFYSFFTLESASEIAEVLTTISSELKVSDISFGALWLRRNRSKFKNLSIPRLRLVWFWLLRSLDSEQTIGENDSVTDVLESVEYIFRRFTPLRTKRLFQVEVVVQLLVELEWRAVNTITPVDIFLKRTAPLCAWLTKIVHLMQLEEQRTQHEGTRNRVGNRENKTNDVQHLTERLAQFLKK